jgi:hypothetical protein
LIALVLLVGPLPLLALRWIAPLESSLGRLVAPVALIGIVNPLLAYRVYLAQRDASRAAAGPAPDTAQRFRRATVLAFAVSGAAALLAGLGYWLTGEPVTMLGLATHVLAAGALWPNEERLGAFEPEHHGAGGAP